MTTKCKGHFKWAAYLTSGQVSLLGETPEGFPILKPKTEMAKCQLQLAGFEYGWHAQEGGEKKVRGYA